jgi:hypothetical protein
MTVEDLKGMAELVRNNPFQAASVLVKLIKEVICLKDEIDALKKELDDHIRRKGEINSFREKLDEYS